MGMWMRAVDRGSNTIQTTEYIHGRQSQAGE